MVTHMEVTVILTGSAYQRKNTGTDTVTLLKKIMVMLTNHKQKFHRNKLCMVNISNISFVLLLCKHRFIGTLK